MDVPHDGHGDRHESSDARKRDVLPRQRGGHPLHTASGKRVRISVRSALLKLGHSRELTRLTLAPESRKGKTCGTAPIVTFEGINNNRDNSCYNSKSRWRLETRRVFFPPSRRRTTRKSDLLFTFCKRFWRCLACHYRPPVPSPAKGAWIVWPTDNQVIIHLLSLLPCT